jgi:endo-1,4-beta-xylanase
VVAGLSVALGAVPNWLGAEPETSVPPVGTPHFSELPASIPLWVGRPPGYTGQDSSEVYSWEHWGAFWSPVVTNINFPALLPFLPLPAKATGVAVVVCPGGGHEKLALEHEGYAVGRWFADHGIAAFVLKYRLAKAPGSTYRVDVQSLMDAQRAIRTVRFHAYEWGIDQNRVGIIGFSAGGEVAYYAATRFDHPVPGSSDAVDTVSCRPDFAGLFYPGLEHDTVTVPPHAPPVFLCAAADDQNHLDEPCVRLYSACKEAGVPAELHLFATGGHGFGIRRQPLAAYSWPTLFVNWLGERGTR